MVDMGQADRGLRQINSSVDEGVFQRFKELLKQLESKQVENQKEAQ